MVVLQTHVRLHRDIVARVGSQQTSSLQHAVVPAHDALLDHRPVLDHAPAHDGAVLDHTVVADAHALADHHVGTDLARRANLHRWMLRLSHALQRYNQHIALDALSLNELAAIHLLLALANEVKIERSASHVVFRLSDVHPEAVQDNRVQLLVLSHEREYVSLDGRGLVLCVSAIAHPYGNSLQDGRSEHVNARVDVVADVLLRLLDKAINQALYMKRKQHAYRFIGNDHTVLRRIRDGSHLRLRSREREYSDGALLSVLLMELKELLQRVGT